ncbi:precorrin-3B synthase [Phyllobacterium zundukense]|nr:precorrin-3B synthase [Phyllobacterium zundukense]ATU93589.1 precorrin-3B synthase [Phyllobacterium zundukense]
MDQLSKPALQSTVEDRRSACPGLFRMARALDGSICRVKLTFGDLSADQARSVADTARCFGNGVIEITNRANLQIRGVRPDTENPLIAMLLEAGLGPLTDKGDDVRNVMISPIAGLHTNKIDARPLAARVLSALQTNATYQNLSPKFSILIDGGESLAMVDHPHDLWLSPIDPDCRVPRYAFGVAGIPPTRTGDQPALGSISAEQAFDLVTNILDLFIDWNRLHPAASRLRHMVAETGTDMLVEQIEHRLGCTARCKELATWRRAIPRQNGHLGVVRQGGDGTDSLVGAMPPLGRLDPDLLQSLAVIADRYSNGQLRMTPWQSVLLPEVSIDDARSALIGLESLGFSASLQEPLATMISCSGAAGCGSALAATQSDGLKLAALLRDKTAIPQVHMSGCSKSCASPSAKPVTLVATAPGHYDIFLLATNGPSRFGKLLAANVTIEEAAELIGENSGSGGPLNA